MPRFEGYCVVMVWHRLVDASVFGPGHRLLCCLSCAC